MKIEPGREEISGAQDAIGICFPGLTRHYYEGAYWPTEIESCHDESVLTWLEDHLSLINLWPRPPELDLIGSSQNRCGGHARTGRGLCPGLAGHPGP